MAAYISLLGIGILEVSGALTWEADGRRFGKTNDFMKTWKYGICVVIAFALALSAAHAESGEREAESEERDAPRGVGERLRGLDVPDRAVEAAESGAEAVEGVADRARRGVERRQEAAERQLERFETNHLRRLAQLHRVRELAEEHGRTDALERVEELIERELDRYGDQLVRVQRRLGLVQDSDTPDND